VPRNKQPPETGAIEGDGPRDLPVPGLSGVIFDMDGVIVDSEPLSLRIISEIAADRGLSIEPRTIDEMVGVSLGDVLRNLTDRLTDDSCAKQSILGQLRRDYDERYLPALKVTATPTRGLKRLVRDLQTARIPMAIASSSTLEEIDAVVEKLGLRDAVHSIASAEEVARPKPEPDVYLLAIKRLGTGSEGMVAIEDSSSGVRAAVAANLRCVAVRTLTTRAHDLKRATLIVNSLEALGVQLLERLVSRSRRPCAMDSQLNPDFRAAPGAAWRFLLTVATLPKMGLPSSRGGSAPVSWRRL